MSTDDLRELARAGRDSEVAAVFAPLVKSATTRIQAWALLEAACERATSGLPVERGGAFHEREIRQLGPVVAWREGRVTTQRVVTRSTATNLRVLESRAAADALVEGELGAASCRWGVRPGPGDLQDPKEHRDERARLLRAGDVAGVEAYCARYEGVAILVASRQRGLVEVEAWTADGLIVEAATEGDDVATIRHALSRGPSPLAVRSAAAVAVDRDRTETFRTLVDAMADVDVEDLGDTLLARAVRAGRPGCVDVLLARKADPDRVSSAFTIHPPITVSAQDGNGPMVNAVRAADLDLLDRLLAAGGDPGAKTHAGRRVVDMAKALGDARIVERLVAGLREPAHGVDMQTAVANADVARVLALLPVHGSQEAIQGWSQHGKADPLRALLDGGAPHDAKTLAKALFYASVNGHADVVRVLLAHGADPNGHTSAGRTALATATGNQHSEVAALLAKAGGKKRAK